MLLILFCKLCVGWDNVCANFVRFKSALKPTSIFSVDIKIVNVLIKVDSPLDSEQFYLIHSQGFTTVHRRRAMATLYFRSAKFHATSRGFQMRSQLNKIKRNLSYHLNCNFNSVYFCNSFKLNE